jgi:hypothetical protein
MGGSIVSFTATPQQLEILRRAIDAYCTDCGIADNNERLYIAELVVSLFDLGVLNLHDIRCGLDDAIGPCPRPTRH